MSKPATTEDFSFHGFKTVLYKPQVMLCTELLFQDHTVTAIIWYLNMPFISESLHILHTSLSHATYRGKL